MKTCATLAVFALFVCAGPLCVRGLGSETTGAGRSDWVRQLTSKDEQERGKAKALIVADREEMIESLLSVVRKPVSKGEEFYNTNTPRNIAISLLGTFRAVRAVPDLITWLEPKQGHSALVDELLALSPAGYALVEIGLPSVQPVLDIIREKGCSSPDTRERIVEGNRVRYSPEKLERRSPLGDQCLGIIVRIKGVEETEFTLQKAMEAETDDVEKENLKSALTLLKDPKFRRPYFTE